MKPLLVGELNPHGGPPERALLPHPTHGAGGRLAKILGLMDYQYMRAFDRVNLCSGEWDWTFAKDKAMRLWYGRENETFVLLGAKVCRAFGVEFKPFTRTMRFIHELVILPHPSGLSRAWNDRRSRYKARRLLRAAGVSL